MSVIPGRVDDRVRLSWRTWWDGFILACPETGRDLQAGEASGRIPRCFFFFCNKSPEVWCTGCSVVDLGLLLALARESIRVVRALMLLDLCDSSVIGAHKASASRGESKSSWPCFDIPPFNSTNIWLKRWQPEK